MDASAQQLYGGGAVIGAAGHHHNLADKDTQKNHFITSTVLTSVALGIAVLILIINIWYYWYHHSHINTKQDETLEAIEGNKPVEYTENPNPVVIGGSPPVVTNGANITHTISPGSTGRAGVVVLNPTTTSIAGNAVINTITIIGYPTDTDISFIGSIVNGNSTTVVPIRVVDNGNHSYEIRNATSASITTIVDEKFELHYQTFGFSA